MRWVDRTSPVSRATTRDLVLVDDGQDPPTGMGGTDPQVMQAAGPAQGDRGHRVGQVVAEPEVARGAAPGRVGPGARPVRLGRRDPPDGPVRPLLVVVEAEGIELRLQLGQGPRGGLAARASA